MRSDKEPQYMAALQSRLPLEHDTLSTESVAYRDKLVAALRDDLDFHDENGSYASHNFHSFPAKFPPQLPRAFIANLTAPGDVVLDPMMGSGTTVLEAFLAQRRAVGFDIDPLALLIAQTKIIPLTREKVLAVGNTIIDEARRLLREDHDVLEGSFNTRWDTKTREFVDYWFHHDTQVELAALLIGIESLSDTWLRNFFRLAFSSTIITKSGGVSLALDLGHTRPHRAKYVVTIRTAAIADGDGPEWSVERLEHLTKTKKSPIEEFRKRFQNNLKGVQPADLSSAGSLVSFANAEDLPLADASIDLIVTSPPYASNAIDYMRAHKFSLVWFGYPIEQLSERRKTYIGGENVADHALEALPDEAAQIINEIASLDARKGRVLHLYYSEMTRVLRQMFRVLKPGKASIVVVGSSVMRGRDTKTQDCLAAIGRSIGFDVPAIGVRHLDRDRRMLPTGWRTNSESQIEQRMHEEYVIGFLKPSLL
jgi:DNA modification methylase